MIKLGKFLIAKIVAIWLVASGKAIPVMLYDEDISIVTIETEGSKVTYLGSTSFISNEDSYNILLSKLVLWICSKPRFFWTADILGNKVKELAEEYFEEHKKTE